MTTALTRYEAGQLEQIEALKAEVPGVISHAMGLFALPLAWVAQKALPGAAIQGALDLSNLVARHLTDVDDVLRDAGVSSIEELRHLDLERLDRLANRVHDWAMGVAAAEDAQFIYGVLSISGANSMKEKVASLGFLRTLEVVLVKQTWKAMSDRAVANRLSQEGALVLARTLTRQLGINLTRRKALAVIPVIGAVVGGSANGWWLKEVGWAARRAFQERWLVDAGKLVTSPERGPPR